MIINSAHNPKCQEMCSCMFRQIRFKDVYDPFVILTKDDYKYFLELMTSFPCNKAYDEDKKSAVDILVVVLIQEIAYMYNDGSTSESNIKDYHNKVELFRNQYRIES